MGDLDRDNIAALDASGLLSDVLGMPQQLVDALWRVESAGLSPHDSAGGLIVAGMGGSAIAGSLARAALGDQASRPILSARGYGLPPWTTPDTTVLCASYSGDTEETLACYESAGAVGAHRVVVTSGGRIAELARADGVAVIPIPGGFQPRAAIGYLLVATLEVAALCGAAPHLAAEIDVAADHLGVLAEEWGPEGADDSQAKQLARSLHGTIPVFAGAGLTAPVAYRWKTQVNENAKQPAFWAELPELDHNEIAGWSGVGALARFSAVFLDDCDSHPRLRQRIELTEHAIAPHVTWTGTVGSRGESALERVCSLVLLGDLMSLYLAVLAGTDPTPVTALADMKQALAKLRH
jgi:glucose/mannose-6-phosphate isomerase